MLCAHCVDVIHVFNSKLGSSHHFPTSANDLICAQVHLHSHTHTVCVLVYQCGVCAHLPFSTSIFVPQYTLLLLLLPPLLCAKDRRTFECETTSPNCASETMHFAINPNLSFIRSLVRRCRRRCHCCCCCRQESQSNELDFVGQNCNVLGLYIFLFIIWQHIKPCSFRARTECVQCALPHSICAHSFFCFVCTQIKPKLQCITTGIR